MSPLNWNRVRFDHQHKNLEHIDPPNPKQDHDPPLTSSEFRSYSKLKSILVPQIPRYVRSRQFNRVICEPHTNKSTPMPTLKSSQGWSSNCKQVSSDDPHKNHSRSTLTIKPTNFRRPQARTMSSSTPWHEDQDTFDPGFKPSHHTNNKSTQMPTSRSIPHITSKSILTTHIKPFTFGVHTKT